MKNPVEKAIANLTRARANHKLAVTALAEAEKLDGASGDCSANVEARLVAPAMQALIGAEKALAAIPAVTLGEATAKLSELLNSDIAPCTLKSLKHDLDTVTPAGLALRHASANGHTPPASILSEDGAPSDELLKYCGDHGLSLDAVFRWDAMETTPSKLWDLAERAARSGESLDELMSDAEATEAPKAGSEQAGVEDYELRLSELANLVHALQIACWQYAQETHKGGAAQTQSAIIGLGDAMEKVLEGYP